jgi:hypothetical protein
MDARGPRAAIRQGMNRKTPRLFTHQGSLALLATLLSTSCAPLPELTTPVAPRTVLRVQALTDDDELPPRDPDGFAPVIGRGPRETGALEYIVAVDDALTDAQFAELLARAGRLGRVLAEYRDLYRGFAAVLDARAVDQIRTWTGVQYLERDHGTRLTLARGLDRIDQRRLPLDDQFNMVDGGEGVDVYVVDSGVRTTHEEFGGRASSLLNAVDGEPDEDCANHGTLVASIIAGRTSGVAKRARIISVRVANCRGGASNRDTLKGLNSVRRDMGRRAVVNVSLGGAYSWSLNRAVRRLRRNGAIVAVAAGNGDPITGLGVDACATSPASESTVLTVGNTEPLTDRRAPSSNVGRCLDLFAPGVSIEGASSASDSATTTNTGTSFSAPHVAGIAALMFGDDSSADADVVEQRLLAVATPNVVIDAGAGSPNRLAYAVGPMFSGEHGWYVGDFNGDGRDDLARHITGSCGAEVLLSTATSFRRAGCWTLAGVSGRWRIADFDGDGRSDLVRSSGSSDGTASIQVLRSTGTSFAAPELWSDRSAGASGLLVGRFTTDPFADLLRTTAVTAQTEVLISTGFSFTQDLPWTAESDGDRGWIVGDYNGDGRDDVLRYRAGISGGEVFTSNGSAFVAQGSWTLAGDGDDRWYVGDFNGDNRDDISRYRAGISGAEVFLSNGVSFVAAGSWTLAGHHAERFVVGDFNGDNRDDLLRTMPGAQGAQPMLSNGAQFVLQHDWSTGDAP